MVFTTINPIATVATVPQISKLFHQVLVHYNIIHLHKLLVAHETQRWLTTMVQLATELARDYSLDKTKASAAAVCPIKGICTIEHLMQVCC